VIKDVNDQLINRLELRALDGFKEQDPIYYRNLMERYSNYQLP